MADLTSTQWLAQLLRIGVGQAMVQGARIPVEVQDLVRSFELAARSEEKFGGETSHPVAFGRLDVDEGSGGSDAGLDSKKSDMTPLTRREIAEMTGWHPSTVSKKLNGLPRVGRGWAAQPVLEYLRQGDTKR